MPEKFFSTAEVAGMLGISRIAVFKKIKTGKLKAMQVGRGYVITKNDFLELHKKMTAREHKKELSTD